MKPGELIAGRFEVLSFVGEGGMGSVYRALDQQTGDHVAIKHVRPSNDGDGQFFVREARALCLLNHPAIVRYVAHGTAQSGEPYLAMEWLEGETLRTRLTRERMSVDEAVALARRVAGALSHAHAHGIVHRDLNPANLLLVDGRVESTKVLDFGLARHRGDRSETTAPMPGAMGTLGYMAPEQARGSKDLDFRADLFSLGSVLFECLTGEPAFGADNYLAVLAKIVVASAPRARDIDPGIPVELDKLLASLLAKDPADRPAGADAVLDALAALGGSRPSLSAPSQNETLALTSRERVLASVIVARSSTASGGQQRARAVADRYETSLDHLADGSLVLTSATTEAATDQAARAARCALELRAALAPSAVALATGWAVVADGRPAGAVVDRAAMLLDQAAPGQLRADDVTVGLLSPRFEVNGDGSSLLLVGEREDALPARMLLGRAVPCVGRDRELRTLHALIDEGIDAPMAQAILLTGPAGVGKSRIRYELTRQLGERHPELQIWVGRGDPMRAGSSLAILARALRHGLGLSEAEDVEVQRRKVAARIARNVADEEQDRVAEFISELLGLGDEHTASVQMRAARQDSTLMSDQTRQAVVELFEAELRARPLLVILEDMQWGDAATTNLLNAALRQLSEAPFTVTAIARPDVHELFPDLWKDREVQEIRVGALTRRAAETLVKGALPDADEAKVTEIVQRAAGNAFFLEELIRACATHRQDELPQTVLAMVKERLESMEPESRRVLRAASVYGQSFRAGATAALLGGESVLEEVQAWLSTLEEREVVTRRHDGEAGGEEEYAFRHSLVRDAAYAMLTEEDRILGHRLAAEHLCRMGVRDSVSLAEHFERGGALESAVQWWHQSANDALDANDFEAALSRVERGARFATDSADVARLALARAEALRLRGDAEQAAKAVEQAVANAPRGSAIWCNAAGERALVLQRLGLAAELEHAADDLDSVTPTAEAGDAFALARIRTALALLRVGLRERAGQLATRVQESRSLLGPLTMAYVHAFRAVSALLEGNPARYLVEARSAIAHHDAVGDARSALEQRINIGSIYLELGAFELAEGLLREALRTAERLSLPHAIAGAEHNLGLALAHLGQLDEAARLQRRALDAFRKIDRRLEGGAQLALAMICRLQLDLSGAAEHASTALELLLQAAPPLAPAARATLAPIRHDPGRIADSAERAQLAHEELCGVGRVEYGEHLIRWVHAKALAEGGQRAEARKVADVGRARLLEQADKLDDPTLRQSFLTAVADNAQLIALAESLSEAV